MVLHDFILINSLQNLNIELVSPECNIKIDFWGQYTLKMFLPILILIWFNILLLLRYMYQGFSKSGKLPPLQIGSKDQVFQVAKESAPLLSTIIVTFYTFIITSAFSPLICVSSGDTVVMYKEPSTQCYDASWYRYFPLVVVSLIVYCILTPAMIWWILRTSLVENGDVAFKHQFGMLAAPFKRSFYYWELMSILKRTLFVICSQFLVSRGYYVKMTVSVTVMWVFLMIEAYFQPYITRSSNFLSNT
jgi:hypothetical protein